MGSSLSSSFIFNTTAWIDTSAPRLWRLLADTSGWPGWWTAMARCEPMAAQRPRLSHTPLGGRWRVALGCPLHLGVATLASQSPEWLTLRLDGDLQGQITFTLQPADSPGVEPQRGLDLSCRCELEGPWLGFWPGRLQLERRIRLLMQTLARDLGQSLQCHCRVLGHWQGSRWRG